MLVFIVMAAPVAAIHEHEIYRKYAVFMDRRDFKLVLGPRLARFRGPGDDEFIFPVTLRLCVRFLS